MKKFGILKAVLLLFVLFIIPFFLFRSPDNENLRITNIAEGWSGNSINTVIFRHNSITSFGNYQFTAFYNDSGNVVLAKRALESENWEIKETKYKGEIKDAHRSISIMLDGMGFLHMVWDQHDNKLHYCRSIEPFSNNLTDEIPMTGIKENSVTYPGFLRMPDGNLLFFYRDGESGNGNLNITNYDTKTQSWSKTQENLINGEGQRNAYWQACTDKNGTIHISWVWRETWDVATNHDLCYAKSTDGGETWCKSSGERYTLPITAENAEYIAKIPQKSELINQTSMYADNKKIYIASYWATPESGGPQYHLVYFDGSNWKIDQITNRKTAFSLSGGGTKKIPISRPQVFADSTGTIYMIFRDEERKSCVTAAICKNLETGNWQLKDLTPFTVNMWEPSYDTELWKEKNLLNLFVQYTAQADAEGVEIIQPKMVSVLEWKPL